MAKIVMTVTILTLVCFIFSAASNAGLAEDPEEEIKIIKIAAKDQSAVVQSAHGRMKVVHQGDHLKPHGKIVSIKQERIVLKNKNAETIIISFKNGKQTIQRIGKMSKTAAQPRVRVPATSDQQSGRQHSDAAKALPEKKQNKQ